MTNYWVVGASWGGVDHQDKKFIEQGIWRLGYDESEQPAQFKSASQMKQGDRIAIKRMKGRGQEMIRILHLGVIKDVITDTSKIICIVDWVATDLDRDIESKGCYKTVSGPFKHGPWVEKVFCL